MKFYLVEGGHHHPTLEEAKTEACYMARTSFHDVSVDRVEISTTKENMLRLLNDSGGTHITEATVYIAKANVRKTND
jgi:hypothetical protein